MLEFSRPDIRYLFWGTQLNLTYLNTNTTYKNNPWLSEKNLCIEIPALIGAKFPVGRQFQWFIKGGPTIGIILMNREYSSNIQEDDRYGGSAPSVGGELYSGLQLGRNFQLSVGHRWNMGTYEYDYTKVSLSYMF